MTRPRAAVRAGVALFLLAALAGCAARTVAPPAVATPKFQEFVFPAAQGLADPALAARHDAAWQWLQAGDPGAAEREFEAVLKRRPRFAPSEAGLAYVSLARRDAAKAVERFDRALAHAPDYAPALAGKGQALLALGRDTDALASFEAAAAADPSLDLSSRIAVLRFRGAQDHVATARKTAERGQLAEARAAYEQAIEGSPDSAFLYRELAVVEAKDGARDRALEHVRQALTLDPADARAHGLLGDLLLENGDAEGAVRAYSEAARLDPAPEVAAKLESARARAAAAKLPAEYGAITTAADVTRGDVAAVLGTRLADATGASRAKQGALMTDIRGHWAAPWILQVVRAGVMEPFPNHTFQPRQRVRRVEFAQVASRVLAQIAARLPSAGAAWQGARVTVADVPPTHPAHPAVSQVVAAGVLPLGPGGTFEPTRPLSGPELMAAVARLEALARRPAPKPR